MESISSCDAATKNLVNQSSDGTCIMIQNDLRSIHKQNVMYVLTLTIVSAARLAAAQEASTQIYQNKLTPISNPKPLLADYPEFVQPVVESQRFEAPVLVGD